MNLTDPTGEIPPLLLILEYIWDALNIAHDVITEDEIGLVNDIAAFYIPLYPAGITKVCKIGKNLPKFTKKMLSNSKTMYEGRKIRKVDELVSKFGGKAENWKKRKGWDEFGNEWHWYENNGNRVGIKRAGEPDPF